MRRTSQAETETVFEDDDIPDISTPEWEAHIRRTGVLQAGTRGRPRAPNPKVQTTLRLDPDVVERFKADGPGWQTRMNDALRKAVGL
ncbi:BrnA antitoxin family protein [Wenxinia marina]|nr:BrnA antitoxin family protein [Wenxinia marina]GGL66478.1 hypothetical protein GCM10011392_21220 [Wenxinia marina]